MSKNKINLYKNLFSANINEAAPYYDIIKTFIIAINQDGVITFINQEALKHLGYHRNELIGKDFIQDLVVSNKQDVIALLLKSINQKRLNDDKYSKYYLNCKKDGTTVIDAKTTLIEDDNEILGILISGNNITHYIEHQKTLKSNLELYRILANNIPDINLYLFDTSLKFILVEGNEMKNNDLSKENFEGLYLTELNDKELINIWSPLFKQVLQGEEVSSEYSFNNYYYYIWLIPIYSSDNHIESCVAITQNITEDKLTERKLKKSKEEAEKANRVKTDFIARVSHEIRTPLNAILGFAEQLSHSKLNHNQKEQLNIINKSAEHLHSLINDILVLSKIEARQIRFDRSPFKLSYTLKYVFDSLSIKAKEKNLVFSYQIDDRLDTVLLGDAFRLRQILMNLLSNAIKFTHTGYVQLNCTISEEKEDVINVKFDIIDTGIGISKNNLSTIFEKYKQADIKISKKYGGTGLGLAICKNLIELQNGILSVSSQLNKGTTFSFVIPYQKGTPNDIIREDIGDVDSLKLKDKRVLLVDDDNFNRLLGKTILDKFKCQTDVAKNGEQAILFLQNNNYDIILLDIHMLDISGLDVAEFLRKEKKDKATLILAVTAAVMKDDIQEYYRLGINDFLIKPYKEISLFNKMCELFNIQKSPLLETKQILTNENKHLKKLYDLTELELMAEGNKLFKDKMLITFIENSKNTIKQFKKSLKNNNWEQIGEAAHKLLPSVRHLKMSSIESKLIDIKTNTIITKNYTVIPSLLKDAILEMEKVNKKLKNEIGKV